MSIYSIFEDKTLIIVYLAGFLTIIYVISELFGFFSKKQTIPFLVWLHKQEKTLLLSLVVCILSISVKMYNTQKKMSTKTDRLEEITSKIDNKVKLVDELNNIKNGFDPILDTLFGVDLNDKISFFDKALNLKQYQIKDRDKFVSAYVKTLRMFPDAHVLATSLIDSSYFWSGTGEEIRPIEKEIIKFIKNGGKMTRIFYMDEKTRFQERTQRVLDRQVELGVEVYTVNKDETNKQLFVLYDTKDFGWIVKIDPDDKRIIDFLFTRNAKDLTSFKEEFDRLLANNTCKRCLRK